MKKVLNICDDENDIVSDSEIDSNEEDEEINEYFDAMSNELKDSKIGEDFEPLNIDGKTMSNFLESFKSQEGLAGPASTILTNLGFNMNDILDENT